MFDFISQPMGWILAQLSKIFANNFAASVLLFTILVNVALLPLTLKSQKSTAKQARIKHKLDALKKKYGDDRQKYSMAMQELYTKEGISMGGGCMPMIIRLIIMMGVFYAISSPFTYVAGIDTTAINSAKQWASYVEVAESDKISEATWAELGLEDRMDDPDIIEKAQEHGSEDYKFYAKLALIKKSYEPKDAKDSSAEKAIKEQVKENVLTREVEIANYLKGSSPNYDIIVDVFKANGGDLDKINEFDFDLFGIDLRDIPDFSWNFAKGFDANWLIPIASFLAALLTGVLSSIMQKKANPEAPSMMAMMLIMPLFSLFIAFSAPCAVGYYWACSSLVSGGIQVLTQMFYGPAVVNARSQARNIVVRAEKEQKVIDAAEMSADEK